MWAEWHKQQTHVITAELNRRVAKGEISANEAYSLVEAARLKRIEQQNKLVEDKAALRNAYNKRLEELMGLKELDANL